MKMTFTNYLLIFGVIKEKKMKKMIKKKIAKVLLIKETSY